MRLHHALDGPQAVTDEDRRQPLEERWACQSGANDLWGWVVSRALKARRLSARVQDDTDMPSRTECNRAKTQSRKPASQA